MRAVRWAAIAAAVLTFGMIVLGATIRVTDSGLSCPDWPTCYGHWVPLPSDLEGIPNLGYTYAQVMYEWVHRLIAGVFLGPLILVVAVVAWSRRTLDPRLPLVGGTLVLLLLIQGALGGITVLDSNSPWSVALHLGTALLLLTTLLHLVERATPRPAGPAASPVVLTLAAVAWFVAWITMLSAAMMAKSGAALACTTWPDCNGVLVPDLADPFLHLHFMHRALALLTAVTILVLFLASRRLPVPAGVTRWTHAAVALVVVQVAMGAIVIWTELNLVVAVAHQALGVLTFVTINMALWRCVIGPAGQQTRSEIRHGIALRGA
ncbi:MAG: COX15/CtaA family protein [Geminicoccaceae bacterium]